MMKLRLAGVIVPVVVLVALFACARSNKAVKATAPAPTAVAQSNTAPAATGREASVTHPVQADRVPGQAMAMLKDVHFDFDRYVIRPADAEVLKRDLPWFKTNTGSRVLIEGNCDERGSIEYNLALGQKRADATKNFLVNLGVPANLLKTVSYGKEKPVDPGHDEQAWVKNRRAHLEPQK